MGALKKGLNFPNPLEVAIFLCLLVIVIASFGGEASLIDNIGYWGKGMWSLLAFTTQISLILVGGFVVASSFPIQRALRFLSTIPKKPSQTYLFTFLVSASACWLNWGLGLITGAFLAVEMARKHKPVNFPLLVSVAYMGFIFWHGGLSGSIPLVVGTEGNFSQEFVGSTIGIGETLFSVLNFTVIFCLLVSLSLLVLFLSKNGNQNHIRDWTTFLNNKNSWKEQSEEEASLISKPAFFILIAIMFLFLGSDIILGTFQLGLNQVNFLLLLSGLVLHGSLMSMMRSVEEACRKLAPILIQYPLYAGIMGVMVQSGLAVRMSEFFVSLSNEQSYSSLMFISAGVVNFFVPSGGGQWAVQAPVVTEGARQLGVSMPQAIMAVAWGDAWTNLAQPFWALPLLSIAGVQLKEILGYCLKALVVSGIVIVSVLLII